MTNSNIGRINFGPFHHSILGTSLGYDTMFNELERVLNSTTGTGIQSSEKYPPHNIIKINEYKYMVELAVAGFSKNEIEITVVDGLLTIKGDKNSQEDLEKYSADKLDIVYLHKGISNRSFVKTIRIIDTVEVLGAEYEDGILRISLENVIPESKKPRKIDIADGNLPLVEPDNKQLLTEGNNWKEVKYASPGAGNPKSTGAGI